MSERGTRPVVLTDADVQERLTPEIAIAAMRRSLIDHAAGRHRAPPRVHAQLDGGRLIYTAGQAPGRWFGYRSYDSFGRQPGEQVVVLHDDATGRVRALAIGNALGPMRTGAIGAVALDALARPDAGRLALIGTGVQAWTQLWAIAAVRPLERVWVHSRTPQRREAFAARARDELGLPVEAATSPHESVCRADLVVLATDSASPVIEADWIGRGAFVSTLGPKQLGRAEFDRALVDRVDVAVTDSVAQITAYDPPNILAGTRQADRLVGLGEVLAGQATGRTSAEQRVLFCSVGLAGTEVALLARLIGVS